MVPRVKNYIKKSESYRHKQKKIEDQHIKEINLNYRERQIYTANKRRRQQFLRFNSISRDWIGELNYNPRKRYNCKQTQQLEPLTARNRNIRNISSSTKHIPLDIKMLYPDELSYNYQSFEVLEPEDGMTVTDDEYCNSSNAPLLQQKTKPKVVLPNSSRVNRKTSTKILIPPDDKKSLRFQRKTIVTSTQTELNNQEYEYEIQSESTDSYNQSSNEVYDFKIFNTTNPGRIIKDAYKNTKGNDCEPDNISNEKDAGSEFNIETIEFKPNKEKNAKESDKEKNSSDLNEEKSLSESEEGKNISKSNEEKNSSKSSYEKVLSESNKEKSLSESDEEKNSNKSNKNKSSSGSNKEENSSESNEENSVKRDGTTSSSDESESKSNGLSKNDFSSVYQSDFVSSIKSDFESDDDVT